MSRSPSLRERLDMATLEKLYTEHGLPTLQIALRFGSNSPAVQRLVNEYGIHRRTTGGSKR